MNMRFAALAAAVSVACLLSTLSTRLSLADTGAPDPTCSLERAVGLTDAEAQSVEALVCEPLRASPRGNTYRVNAVRIGTKVSVRLVALGAEPGRSSDQEIVLSSIDELTVAAPRLREAAVEHKSVAETLDVTNVVGDESRKPKKRAGAVHVMLGAIGATAAGRGAGAGINLAMTAGDDRWSFVGDGRLAISGVRKEDSASGPGAEAQRETRFGYVSLAGGARYHLSPYDIAPFVGAGAGLDSVTTKSASADTETTRMGLAPYGEVGIDFLRTATLGGQALVRADIPTFSIEQGRSAYVPILSAGVAMRF